MDEPTIRRLELPADRDFVLTLHGQINYHSDSDWFRGPDEKRYVNRWLETPQVTSFLQQLELSSGDPRALLEVWELGGQPVAYLWVAFTEADGYDLCTAEIQDVGIVDTHRRQGMGRRMLQYIEIEARSRGANILRASAGVGNRAAHALFEGGGLERLAVDYEKLLDDDTSSRDHQASAP